MAGAGQQQSTTRHPGRQVMLALAVGLLVLLLLLQFRLWVGAGSLAERAQLDSKLEQQRNANAELTQRNDVLAAEVQALKYGLEEVESRAREELGMIKPDETFYLIPAGESGE